MKNTCRTTKELQTGNKLAHIGRTDPSNEERHPQRNHKQKHSKLLRVGCQYKRTCFALPIQAPPPPPGLRSDEHGHALQQYTPTPPPLSATPRKGCNANSEDYERRMLRTIELLRYTSFCLTERAS